MEDLRVKKTKLAITGAFIDLVEEKGFDNVKVIDICSKAMINRNTFYLHNLKKESSYNDFESVKKGYVCVLEGLKKEIEFYRIILLDSNMSGYIDKYTSKLRLGLARIYGIDYNIYKIELDYIFYGIVGVIKNWIIKDYSSIDNIATKLAELTLNSMSNFIKK